MTPWLLIDDSPQEAESFVGGLSFGEVLSVAYMGPREAGQALDDGTLAPAGILMDVDLANEVGHQQTGPGMAQNIRVAQHKRQLPAFPIVRFSLRNKVLENIGRDTSSDDIFDLKIEKDGLADASSCEAVQSKLIGVREIYDSLQGEHLELARLLGLDDESWQRWGNPDLHSEFELGDRVYLRASPIVRMMAHPGLLIDEDILAFRLGVDRASSEGWNALKHALSTWNYRGVASDFFALWWARAIEEWWQDQLGADIPLAGCTIDQRVERLSKVFEGLVALTMPRGSMGKRPWRYCLLTKEQRQELIPVDPTRAVSIRPRSPLPSWLDPLYAALGIALQNRGDPRLDKSDMTRLHSLVRDT